MIILSDVDNCIAPSDIAWLEYLRKCDVTNSELPIPKTDTEFNLSKYFPRIEKGHELDFWSFENLYDDMIPIRDSVNVLKKFSKEGHTILFASYCKKGHFGNKYDWLKRHFPFMDGFFATKEKEYIKADVFIDDRNENLNRRGNIDPKCHRIKFNTIYKQYEELKYPTLSINNWGQFYKIYQSKIKVSQ